MKFIQIDHLFSYYQFKDWLRLAIKQAGKKPFKRYFRDFIFIRECMPEKQMTFFGILWFGVYWGPIKTLYK